MTQSNFSNAVYQILICWALSASPLSAEAEGSKPQSDLLFQQLAENESLCDRRFLEVSSRKVRQVDADLPAKSYRVIEHQARFNHRASEPGLETAVFQLSRKGRYHILVVTPSPKNQTTQLKWIDIPARKGQSQINRLVRLNAENSQTMHSCVRD